MEPTYNQQSEPAPMPTPNILPSPVAAPNSVEMGLPNPPQGGYNGAPLPVAPAELVPAQGAALPFTSQAIPTQLPAPAVPIAGTAGQASATVPMPTMADDSDLIEKEWVVKAKQIVSETRQDPYAQSRELNKVRAEYVKKRYNKDLKLPE